MSGGGNGKLFLSGKVESTRPSERRDKLKMMMIWRIFIIIFRVSGTDGHTRNDDKLADF